MERGIVLAMWPNSLSGGFLTLLFSLAWLLLSPGCLQEPLDRTNDKCLHICRGRTAAFPQRWLPFSDKELPVVCAV